MSSDSSSDTPTPQAPPSLSKDDASAGVRGDASRDFGDLRAAPGGSIWEPLDGSTPQHASTEPLYRAPETPGRVGGTTRPGAGEPRPAPHQVAAAYAASAQSAGTFTLAAWGRRGAAYLVDVVVFALPLAAIAMAILHSAGLSQEQAETFLVSARIPDGVGHHTELYATLLGISVLVGILPAVFLVWWNGQTPGKRLLGLRVMRASGAPMTLSVALRRELIGRVILVQAAAVFTLGAALPLNYLWPLWDAQRRAGHDLLADTRVVVAPRGEK